MRELVLYCQDDQAEHLSDVLLESGALSVSLEDADEGTEAEQALFGEPGFEPSQMAWLRNRLVLLLADGEDPDLWLALAAAESGCAPEDFQSEVRDVPDADWVRLTQAQFGPIRVDDRLWIIPSWSDRPAEVNTPGVVSLKLDPGLAFGTGSHPTTHLCLQWLSAHVQPGHSVLDYGCGSGVLAIAAALLGAHPVVAVDIDPQAVQATRDNAAANGVAVQAYLPDALGAKPDSSQVVVANILSNPLKVLAPLLCATVQPGGWLILSGVLERQADEVCSVYSVYLPMRIWRAQDGWVCLVGQRPEGA